MAAGAPRVALVREPARAQVLEERLRERQEAHTRPLVARRALPSPPCALLATQQKVLEAKQKEAKEGGAA